MQKNIKIENGQAWVLKKIQDDAQKGSRVDRARFHEQGALNQEGGCYLVSHCGLSDSLS